jgi:WD40 repeat protein
MLVLSGDDLRESRVAADTLPLDQWGLTAAPSANTAFVSYAPNDPLRIWSVAPDDQVLTTRQIDNPTALLSLAVDRDRNIVAAGDREATVWVWTADKPDPTPYTLANLHDARVTSLAFLSDGRLAAIYENRRIAVWVLGNSVPAREIELENLQFSRVAALSGDIRAAIPLSDRTMLVLSGDDLRETRVPADTVPLDQWGVTAAPAPNTAFVSYSDGSIRRRDLGAGTEGITSFDASTPLCGTTPTSDNNGSRSLDVSADGKWLVATRTDATLIVHNLVDPAKPICLALPAADSKTVAFSPNAQRLAVLSATDRLSVFDLAHPDQPLLLGAPATPENSPGARLAARNNTRTTSWLAWRDDTTLLIATVDGTVETLQLDPAGWHARVDSLFVAP